MHACRSGGNRLLWLKDLEQAVLHDAPSWDEVIERAREWRAALALATMLLRTRRALGVQLPSEVLRALASPTWRTLVASTERLAPVERSIGRDSLAMLVNYSVRSDERTSLIDLERRSRKWLRGARPLRIKRLRADDPEGLPPMAQSSGGPLDRNQYFSAVAAHE